ncbi:hypothetical protein [Catenovulum sediminis]|uniref:Phage tail protein I n=1 Tax=Catenovulum sediminis TaxID=1740262 RepID=A0ABV1RG98_9ALTE|nr:hypothetical protein [Catenovulum sediminis]
MNETELNHLKTAAEPLIQQLPEELEWLPDNRFNALMAEVPKPLFEFILPWLESEFGHKWDRSDIRKAPAEVKDGAGMFAKMENRQYLYSYLPGSNNRLMVAWWPWGPGAPASLRIFLAAEVDEQQSGGIFAKILSVFKGK